jgi:beta-lactamase class C
MLTRRILLLPLAGLFLIVLAWAVTSISFRRASPEPAPAIGITNEQLADIAERQDSAASDVDYARIDQRLEELMQRKSMVGLAVGIVEGGQIRFLKGYGVTVAGGSDPVGTNTIFRWASLSKGVAADSVAMLAGENKLSLYEPVGKYSATLRLPGGDEGVATVSDLLSHRLGLFSHANDSKLEDGMDPRFLRQTLATLHSICRPGQCHAYQNVAYDAASEVVEKVTGRPYRDVVRDRLFRPLGMTSATMTRSGLVTAPSWARPHAGGLPRPEDVAEPYYRVPAAGGVNSSIKDLAIWMQAQMGLKGDVLSPDVLAAVQSPRAITPQELGRMRKFRERVKSASYGLGWRIYDYAGHKVVAHRGGVRGYRSLIMFDPVKKSGIVALWNSSTNQPGGVEFEVMDMIYHLPARDWLALGGGEPGGADPEPDGAEGNQADAGSVSR